METIGDPSENEKGIVSNYLGTIGINWDCPRQVRTNGHSVNHQEGKTVVRFSLLLSCDK